jgi:hypothetical protein
MCVCVYVIVCACVSLCEHFSIGTLSDDARYHVHVHGAVISRECTCTSCDTKVAQGLVGLVRFEIPITVHVKPLENQQAIYVGL